MDVKRSSWAHFKGSLRVVTHGKTNRSLGHHVPTECAP
jgi:hypothetical protein